MPVAAPVVEVPTVDPFAASAYFDKLVDTPAAAVAFAPAEPAMRAGGFPAPARATSAEVLHSGVAIVVLNDDEEDADSPRSGALRRLIESLRRN
jgi:hypothetical protein